MAGVAKAEQGRGVAGRGARTARPLWWRLRATSAACASNVVRFFRNFRNLRSFRIFRIPDSKISRKSPCHAPLPPPCGAYAPQAPPAPPHALFPLCLCLSVALCDKKRSGPCGPLLSQLLLQQKPCAVSGATPSPRPPSGGTRRASGGLRAGRGQRDTPVLTRHQRCRREQRRPLFRNFRNLRSFRIFRIPDSKISRKSPCHAPLPPPCGAYAPQAPPAPPHALFPLCLCLSVALCDKKRSGPCGPLLSQLLSQQITCAVSGAAPSPRRQGPTATS